MRLLKKWLPVSSVDWWWLPAAAAAEDEFGKNHGCCLVGDSEAACDEAAESDERELQPDENEDPAEFLACLHLLLPAEEELLRHSLELELSVSCLGLAELEFEDDLEAEPTPDISWARPPSLVARWKALNVCMRLRSAFRGCSLKTEGVNRWQDEDDEADWKWWW